MLEQKNRLKILTLLLSILLLTLLAAAAAGCEEETENWIGTKEYRLENSPGAQNHLETAGIKATLNQQPFNEAPEAPKESPEAGEQLAGLSENSVDNSDTRKEEKESKQDKDTAARDKNNKPADNNKNGATGEEKDQTGNDNHEQEQAQEQDNNPDNEKDYHHKNNQQEQNKPEINKETPESDTETGEPAAGREDNIKENKDENKKEEASENTSAPDKESQEEPDDNKEQEQDNNPDNEKDYHHKNNQQEQNKPEINKETPRYEWGDNKTYELQVKVNITNQGEDKAEEIKVKLPMLENNSPYQETNLENTSHEKIELKGRTGTFKLNELEPGESEKLLINYMVRARSVSVEASSGTMEKAYEAFEKYAGSGDCHELSIKFVEKLESKDKDIEGRVVTGFANPRRTPFHQTSLAGTRHSWAEFYVEELGWVPVDLTFEYFAEIPQSSHIVETYSADDPIRIQAEGGQLHGSWENHIVNVK